MSALWIKGLLACGPLACSLLGCAGPPPSAAPKPPAAPSSQNSATAPITPQSSNNAESAGAPPSSATSSSAQATVGNYNYFDLVFIEDDSKFKIEGPFYIGDPVHETITLLAAADSMYVPKPPAAADVPELIRGVFWNDDPCAQLFDDPQEGIKKSSGFEWYSDFRDAEKRAKTREPFDPKKCVLLARSHFGDLQFLHGMAEDDGIPALQTHGQVMQWARFTYGLSVGRIDALGPLSDDMARLLLLPAGTRPADLFHARNDSKTRQRALGSLLHLLQDSYAAGHTNRTESSGHRGKIIQFYSYARQDHGKHAEDDAWHGGGEPRERVANIKGGPDALVASTAVLSASKALRPWAEVESMLRQGPLALGDQPLPSAPGADFAKTP